MHPPAPTADTLAALAAEHLDEDAAARWLALLRPAVRLAPAEPGEPVLARLGGTPALPPGVGWPTWPGRGPLSVIAEIDLAAVASCGLDPGLALPTEGSLLAFYRDDHEGDGEGVGTWDPATLAGARLLHVSGGPRGAESPPDGAPAYPSVPLAGRQVTTFPGSEHPLLTRAVGELPDDFDEALCDLLDDVYGDVVGHQLGGWATPVQGPVEFEVAQGALDGRLGYDDVLVAESLRWRPLLQVDSDQDGTGPMWGDGGALYWLARTDATTPVRAEDTGFTWQC